MPAAKKTTRKRKRKLHLFILGHDIGEVRQVAVSLALALFITVLCVADAGTAVRALTGADYTSPTEGSSLWTGQSGLGTDTFWGGKYEKEPAGGSVPADPAGSEGQGTGEPEEAVGTVTPVATTGKGSVAFETQLHESASEDSTVLVTVPKGEEIKLTEHKVAKDSSPWYKTEYEGVTGWICGTKIEFMTLDKSPEQMVEEAILWAETTAADDSHGYSLAPDTRWGNPDYDCSTFALMAYRNAGANLIFADEHAYIYCSIMRRVFTASGFEWISAEKLGMSKDDPEPDTLRRGDVLLDEDQHTAIYLGDGKQVAARQDYGNIEEGDQDGHEIEVYEHYFTKDEVVWDGVLRYTGAETDPNQKKS